MHRKCITLCLAALLLLTCATTVFAQEFDGLRTGSVSVTLTEQFDGAPIVGAELSLYYVATVGINTDGNLNYIYAEPFNRCQIPIDDPTLAIKLEAFVTEEQVDCLTMVTDNEGKAAWTDLPLGMYYVRQTVVTDGYAPCTPFIVMLPAVTEDGYVYEVNATPKTQVAKLTDITIKKVWNTDKTTKAADQVMVELLRDGNLLECAILNEENDWQVTYTNMPESDAYSVRELDVPKGFTVTYKQNGYVFTVTNTSALAQTGQVTWPIPVLAFAGVLLIAAGIVLLQKKRARHG